MSDYECADCGKLTHSEMMLNRQAIFDHEKIIRDDGAVCIGVGICSECARNWPKSFIQDEPTEGVLFS